MDYKSVIEEQIRELQKVQDTIVKNPFGRERTACDIALTIKDLAITAKGI